MKYNKILFKKRCLLFQDQKVLITVIENKINYKKNNKQIKKLIK